MGTGENVYYEMGRVHKIILKGGNATHFVLQRWDVALKPEALKKNPEKPRGFILLLK